MRLHRVMPQYEGRVKVRVPVAAILLFIAITVRGVRRGARQDVIPGPDGARPVERLP